MAILAQQYPIYQPSMRIISSITNDNPALVTTTFKHQYITGLIVRLVVPLGFGMVQANSLYAPIIVTGDTTFTIAIDTTYFDLFLTPMDYPFDYQSAQCVPIGEDNAMLTGAVRNVLPYRAT